MAAIWSDALRRAAEAFAKRRRAAGGQEGEDSGFTLIELMVVLLIMGILMAIAIPTFLGVTNTANDRSAQSNLTNVITSAKAIYAQKGGYPKTTLLTGATGIMKKDLPNFTYTATASTGQSVISIETSTATTGTVFIAAAWMTKSKECWWIKDTAHGTVKYGTAAATADTTCKATKIPATLSTKWPTAVAGH